MIELTGEYRFEAPQDVVWEMFQDPVVLASILPGCEKLDRTGENEFQGKLNIRVGPVQGAFQGKVELLDLVPPHSYRMLINGRGPAGIVKGEGAVVLSADGMATTITYEGEAQVSGRIASVGQRLMDTSAKSIVRQSLENLDAQIVARMAPPVVIVEERVVGEISAEIPPTAAPLPQASQTDYMIGMTQDLLDEYIPNPTHRKLLGGAAILLTAVAFLNWFADLVAKRVVKRMEGK